MVSNRTLVVLFVVVSVLFLSVFLYLAGNQFLRTQVESRLGEAFQHQVEVDRIGFGVFPVELRGHGITIRRGTDAGEPLAVLPEVTVRPELGSLFSDSWTLTRVTLTDPSVTVGSPGETTPALVEEPGTGPRTVPDTSGVSLPVSIRRIRVRNGSLTYFDNSSETRPLLRLTPFNLRVGMVNTRTLRDGIEVRAGTGIDGGEGRLRYNGSIKPTGGGEASGELKADRLALTFLQSFLNSGVSVQAGRFSGIVPFGASPRGIRLDTSTLRVDGARVRLGQPPEIKPETAPIELKESVGDTSVGDSPDTTPYPPVELEEVRLEVLDSEFEFVGESDIPPVDLDRATVLAGPVDRLGDSFPLRAQFAVGKPPGHLQLKGRVAPVVSAIGFEDFIGRLKVQNAGRLNPYVKTVSPVKLKGGELDAAVRGQALDRRLDFRVQLYFKQLRTGSITNPNSTVLGIPVNLFVKYLKQNNGDLNLHFSVQGTPQRPVIDTTGIRTRMLLNLGVDAAVIGTLGVPVYLGNELLQRTSGIDLIGTARSSIGDVLGTNPDSPDPVYDLEGIDSE